MHSSRLFQCFGLTPALFMLSHDSVFTQCVLYFTRSFESYNNCCVCISICMTANLANMKQCSLLLNVVAATLMLYNVANPCDCTVDWHVLVGDHNIHCIQ
ncbi:hypothetical protein NP493_990g00004 [Ridgeia piscesae]|uniref:Secreted protein n=1 Tax=Ridgeia piscesae TaxID=27915 RepID=A0AAD9KIQ3_RIDPI|nr:hypothetical protein NP493_990g00004 [Ridgeia piscesae]